MVRKSSVFSILFLLCFNFSLTLAQDMTTVHPLEYPGGLSNPLMGFRPDLGSYSKYDYPTIVRKYIKWNELENNENDGVDKIINFCNTQWAGLEAANVKVIPRVYLYWDENSSQDCWPADLPKLDWANPKLKDRVVKMIEKLGKAWDNDPRVAWIQTGIIGKWGEQESPVGVDEDGWAERMGAAYTNAFQNKMLLVRNQKYWNYEMGTYWDSFAHPGQSGVAASIKQFNEVNHRYYTQAVEGEVAYNWGTDVLVPVLGNNENETASTPKYYNYLIDVIRELHCSGLGWIASYDPTDPKNTVGASEIQKAFGYRFMLNEFSCPRRVEKGGKLDIMFKVKNIGSAPFYEKWPVAFVLIDEATKNIVWTQILPDIDTRTWLPGDNYNYASRTYSTPAQEFTINKSITVPINLANGKYMAGLTILEPYSRTPGVFFAVKNFLKESQTQPLCRIGIGDSVTGSYGIDTLLFGDLVKDDKRSYTLKWNGPTYSLTTNATTGGSVSPSSNTFNENQKVRLKATPDLGKVFTGWSGDLTGTENPVTVTMDKNKSISANFASVSTYSLTVNAPNATVELTPTGGVYNIGTVVTILIKPNLGYVFGGWSGDLSGTTNPTTITMDTNKTVTANLTSAPIYKLTTNATGGSVTLDPVGPQYTKGTVVKITAKANTGFVFINWSGDALYYPSYNNPNYITMDSDKSITANFMAQVGAPTVSFVKPLDGDKFAEPANLSVTVDAKAATGSTISNVKLYLNDVFVRQENTAPYEWSSVGDLKLQNLPKGIYVLRADATDNTSKIGSNSITITVGNVTSIEQEKTLPYETVLNQNYPNPFNPETTISYQLAEPSHARLTIRNTLGEEVNKLVDRDQAAGRYSVRWNGRDFSGNKVASGIYFYVLEANNSMFAKKLVLLQ